MNRQPLITLMLLLAFFGNAWGRSSKISEVEIERELKILNKPYVKSFKDNYGVAFDCVDIYKQPAFDHPFLKDHKLQFAEVWFDGEEGTSYQSVKASVEVYPLTVPAGCASVTQIRVVDTRHTNATVVQAGWHVDPKLNGDSQSRFVVYWTADDYQETGCANTRCPGFVVTNQAIAPGMVLPTGKSINLAIQKDENGNWQVFLNDQVVGYFPGPVVNGMEGGTLIQMGGTAYSPPLLYISPPMGSGVSPAPGPYNGAAKFTFVSFHGPEHFICKVYRDVENQSFYNVMITSTSLDGPEGVAFQYGGPGGA